jgi:hypothetical protein
MSGFKSLKTMLAAGAVTACLAAAPASAVTYIAYSSENSVGAFAAVVATTDQSDGFYERGDVLSYTFLFDSGTGIFDYSDVPLVDFRFSESGNDIDLFAFDNGYSGGTGLGITANNALNYIATRNGILYLTFNPISISVDKSAPAVPEPATWAMMLVGFGMIGGASRYRRRSTNVGFA